MRVKISILFSLLALVLTGPGAQAADLADLESSADNRQVFGEKLDEMNRRIEMSEKLLRQQIIENPSAPFLADLYLQLGQLLSQKANVLYYLQMETENRSDVVATVDVSKFYSVVKAQKEAIEVYERVITDFPDFDKRSKALYLVALTYKSIDETPKFFSYAKTLIKEYPDEQGTFRVQLLLGQNHYENDEYRDARAILKPVSKCRFVYEKNQANYLLGLIALRNEKFKKALRLFEGIIADEGLEAEDNQVTVSLKSMNLKRSLKREALLDSILAYPHVYKKAPKPVSYYLRIAPSEAMFLEVIEKLALRYINLQKYPEAIKLLRALSERTVDPEKIINIYQEILLIIPKEKRADIEATEIDFVLAKLKVWRTAYEIPEETYQKARSFYEKQVRELATSTHDLAKGGTKAVDADASAKKKKRKKKKKKKKKKKSAKAKAEAKRSKSLALVRAAEFYSLYLGHFPDSNQAAQMASNHGDVYYLQGEYMKSGDLYLRTFHGQFGEYSNRGKLIQDAVFSLEREKDYAFYKQMRVKGLLVSAISAYFDFDASKKTDPRLNFVLVKTRFDQGNYGQAIPGLYAFMKAFPKSNFAVSAGEIILDHFNTKNDFEKLRYWTSQILVSGLSDAGFLAKVERIQQQAGLAMVEETIISNEGYNPTSKGSGYLKAAGEIKDVELKYTALKEALFISKQEKDMETFFKTAIALAKEESDPAKRAEILFSLAQEEVAVARFYDAFSVFLRIAGDGEMDSIARSDALTKAGSVAVALRDVELFGDLLDLGNWSDAPNEVQSLVTEQLAFLLAEPVVVPSFVLTHVLETNPGETTLAGLLKGRFRYDQGDRSEVDALVADWCGPTGGSVLCDWQQFLASDASYKELLSVLSESRDITSLQEIAQAVVETKAIFETFEGSESSLDVAVLIRYSLLFRSFGDFLLRVAEEQGDTSEIYQVLLNKAQESQETAKSYQELCESLTREPDVMSPAGKHCTTEEFVSGDKLLEWAPLAPSPSGKNQNISGSVSSLQREVFADPKNGDLVVELARKHMDIKAFHHAAAVAHFGIFRNDEKEDELQAIIGCSLMELNLVNQAAYYLNQSTDEAAQACNAELKKKVAGL
jgi:hypothetical protein